jgi:hypothetical protein
MCHLSQVRRLSSQSKPDAERYRVALRKASALVQTPTERKTGTTLPETQGAVPLVRLRIRFIVLRNCDRNSWHADLKEKEVRKVTKSKPKG